MDIHFRPILCRQAIILTLIDAFHHYQLEHTDLSWRKVIFRLKCAKLIKSENVLKWSATKILCDNVKNKHKRF